MIKMASGFLVALTLSFGLLINPVASADDNQASYESHLQGRLKSIQESLGSDARFITLNVVGTPKSVDKWELRKAVELALTNNDYTSASEILSELSLTLSQNPQLPSMLTVHPYQPDNSAYRIVKALIENDSNRVMQELVSPDDTLNDIVYLGAAMGETPLTSALSNADLATIRALLAAGADPQTNAGGLVSFSPMTRAVAIKNYDAVYALIEAGADVNTWVAVPTYGPTLLSYAASTGNTTMFEYLLERGADADKADGYGWTPLMDAVHAQDWPLIQRLLPISNPAIMSTRKISESSSDKGLDRYYPKTNAVYIAEQIDSALGKKIRQALQNRMAEFGESTETLLLKLQNIETKISAASNENRIADALDVSDEGIAMVNTQPLEASTHADIINHAIYLLVVKHELAIMAGDNLNDSERVMVDKLIAIGGQYGKWHDMLDVFYAAKTADPKPQLDTWLEKHGQPSRKGWKFDLLTDWIESFEDVTVRDRLYDTLDFFELN
ncbi:MAG: ankyrin repeat domain-containing protein [Granulosicoccus sp.]